MISSIQVTVPTRPIKPIEYQTKRAPLELINICEASDIGVSDEIPVDLKNISPVDNVSKQKLGFSYFTVDSKDYALVKDLASSWNFPSSYQLISKFVKSCGISKNELVATSTKELNEILLNQGAISKDELKFSLFYIELGILFALVKNKDVFFADSLASPATPIIKRKTIATPAEVEPLDFQMEDVELEDTKKNHKSSNERITISQVFPQYRMVEMTLPLNHSAFNTLTTQTKLKYYKSIPGAYKFLPNTKLNFTERDLIAQENSYSDVQVTETKKQQQGKKFRKPFGKSRKHNTNVDPNTIDLTESIIPGQGFIQEFNVNHLCKVPNYYITSNQQNPIGKINLKNINSSSNSSFLFNDNIKISNNVKQLKFNNDNDSYHHAKYYYTKTYRGPGSGNYKDAAVMNRINRIQTTPNISKTPHKVAKVVNKSAVKRYNQSLKGLVHNKFNQTLVDSFLSKQRRYTEDYVNMEMLHSNVQFNLLVNTYRNISEDTWDSYYKFKMVDFEQLGALQRENAEIEAKKREIELRKEWERSELERQQLLQAKIERQRTKLERIEFKKIQKQKKLEEKKRRRQLEATFNDPFGDGSDAFDFGLGEKDLDDDDDDDLEEEDEEDNYDDQIDLNRPVPPPMPVETPQLDVLSRFTLPQAHKEVIQNLPVELRDYEQIEKNHNPSIKKVIRYTATYADSNPEVLNKIEIVKMPSSNAVGWDNLRKYRAD